MTAWPEVTYDPAIWIQLPLIWNDQTWPDYRTWARETAEACWSDFDLEPGAYSVDNLALTLAAFVEKLQPDDGSIPLEDFYLHLPDPRLMPLHVSLAVLDAEGDREQALREMTNADDPDAVESPTVEIFGTEHLGEGLRTLRYCPFDPGPDHQSEPGALFAAVNYAWRVEEHKTDVRLHSACPDIARLVQVIDDIDELARGIHLLPRRPSEFEPP